MSSIVDIKYYISLKNRFCVCLLCPWCRTPVFFLASLDAVNSLMTLGLEPSTFVVRQDFLLSPQHHHHPLLHHCSIHGVGFGQ